MLIVPTILAILSGPAMWNVSEVLYLFVGFILLVASIVIKNEVTAITACAIFWVAIFLWPTQLERKPKIRLMAYIFQGIFSSLNALLGILIIGGKYV